jgi:hypothetical protein
LAREALQLESSSLGSRPSPHRHQEVILVAQGGGGQQLREQAEDIATAIQAYCHALRTNTDVAEAREQLQTRLNNVNANRRQEVATEACRILRGLNQQGHTYNLQVRPSAGGLPPYIDGQYTVRVDGENVVTNLTGDNRITIPMPGMDNRQEQAAELARFILLIPGANSTNLGDRRTDVYNAWHRLPMGQRTRPHPDQPASATNQPPFLTVLNARLATNNPPYRVELVSTQNGQRDYLRLVRTDTNAEVTDQNNRLNVGSLSPARIAQLDAPGGGGTNGATDTPLGGDEPNWWLIGLGSAAAFGAASGAVYRGFGIPAFISWRARRAEAALNRQVAEATIAAQNATREAAEAAIRRENARAEAAETRSRSPRRTRQGEGATNPTNPTQPRAEELVVVTSEGRAEVVPYSQALREAAERAVRERLTDAHRAQIREALERDLARRRELEMMSNRTPEQNAELGRLRPRAELTTQLGHVRANRWESVSVEAVVERLPANEQPTTGPTRARLRARVGGVLLTIGIVAFATSLLPRRPESQSQGVRPVAD